MLIEWRRNRKKIRATVSSITFLHTVKLLYGQQAKKTGWAAAALRHLSSFSVFLHEGIWDCWRAGESRGKKEKKNSQGSLSCLISRSMTPSPCQPLLSPWKPALLHRQVREKPPSPRCGVLCVHLYMCVCLTTLRCHLSCGQSCPLKDTCCNRFLLIKKETDKSSKMLVI